MKTTFTIAVTKEAGFVYVEALGVKAHGDNAFKAVAALMGVLDTKRSDLEAASKYNALSEAATQELRLLRGILLPKEDRIAPAEDCLKRYKR